MTDLRPTQMTGKQINRLNTLYLLCMKTFYALQRRPWLDDLEVLSYFGNTENIDTRLPDGKPDPEMLYWIAQQRETTEWPINPGMPMGPYDDPEKHRKSWPGTDAFLSRPLVTKPICLRRIVKRESGRKGVVLTLECQHKIKRRARDVPDERAECPACAVIKTSTTIARNATNDTKEETNPRSSDQDAHSQGHIRTRSKARSGDSASSRRTRRPDKIVGV